MRRIRSRSVLAAFLSSALLPGCCGPGVPDWLKLPSADRTYPLAEVEYPGYFDMGAGYGIAFNTRDGDNNDADGILVSFKAYPWGRWYSEPKGSGKEGIPETLQADAKRKAELLKKLRSELDAACQALKTVTLYTRDKASEPTPKTLLEALDGEPDKASAVSWEAAIESAYPVKFREGDAFKSLKEDAKKLEEAPAKALDDAIEGLKKIDKLEVVSSWLVPLADALTKAADELFTKDKAASKRLEDQGKDLKVAAEVKKDIAKAFERLHDSGMSKGELVANIEPASIDHLESLGKGDVPKKWVPISERNTLWHRFSVFYGHSASDFTGGGLTSPVNAIGVGFDVSPDLALMFGRAFFEAETVELGLQTRTVTDTDSSWFFGVSLNLFAFRTFLANVAGAVSK